MKVKNKGLRWLFLILCVVCAVVGSLSIVGAYVVHEISDMDLTQRAYENAASLALYNHITLEGQEQEEDSLEENGIEYGIVKAEENKDLTKKSSYEYSNFKQDQMKEEDLYSYTLEGGKYSTFTVPSYVLSGSSLQTGYNVVKDAVVKGFAYDENTSFLFAYVGDRYYKVDEVGFLDDDVTGYDMVVDDLFQSENLDGKSYYTLGKYFYPVYEADDNRINYFIINGDETGIAIRSSQVADVKGETAYLTRQVDGHEPSATSFYVSNGKVYMDGLEPDDTITSYNVVFYVPSLPQYSAWEADNYFAQAKALESLLQGNHLMAIVIIMIALSICLGLFFFISLIRSASLSEDGKAHLRGRHKFPQEIYWIGMIIGISLSVISCADGIRLLVSGNYELASCIIILVATIITVALTALFIIAWAMSLSVLIQNKSLKDGFLSLRIVKVIHRQRLMKQQNASLFRTYVGAGLFYGVFVIAELVGTAVTNTWVSEGFTLLWVVEKVIFAVVLLLLLRQFGQLRMAAQKIALGELAYQVDTSHMYAGLAAHGQDLNHIAQGLEEAVSKQLKSERMKTELITNVSHDIKTPLTSIISYVDLLSKEEIESDKIREYLEVLKRQSDRLKKLIEDLLEASKASTGNIKLNLEKIPLGVILSQVIGEFEERLEEKDITFHVQDASKQTTIYVDVQQLWRVFDNLLTNIYKYGQEHTRAYINLKEEKGIIKLSFLNTSKEALNISPDELMERFVRGDASRNTEGSGLGLSIAKSLTNLMGGDLNIEIQGDLFIVNLEFPTN